MKVVGKEDYDGDAPWRTGRMVTLIALRKMVTLRKMVARSFRTCRQGDLCAAVSGLTEKISAYFIYSQVLLRQRFVEG